MQETELHVKKRRKRYLTLLTVMLMMAGYGAGLAGSSSQALAKGKQRDFNSVAAKNSKNFTKGEKLADASWTGRKYVHSFDARNGEMIPGKDFDGYLKFPNLKKASSRPKGFSYYLCGGTKSNWSVDTAKSGTVLYKYSDKDKGHIGIYYKNAAYYYDKDMKKPKLVSLRLTMTNWTDPSWTWGATNGSLHYFRFHPHKIGFNARGDGVVVFHVDIIGVKNKKIPLSFWDLDYGQHIRVPKLIEAYHRTPTKVVYEGGHWFGGAPGKSMGIQAKYLQNIYQCVTGHPPELHDLQKENFTIREMAILTGMSKSTVGRKLRDD